MLENIKGANIKGAIKNGQSRETGNIGYTNHYLRLSLC